MLVSAEATRAFGALPYDFPKAVGIFIIVPPGTPGSQKQQQKKLGKGTCIYINFLLQQQNIRKKNIYLYEFSLNNSAL